MRDMASSDLNDVTSAKQNVDATTGVVVQANNASTNTYWHYDSLAPAPAAVTEARNGAETAPNDDPRAASAPGEPAPAGAASVAPAPPPPPSPPPAPPAPPPPVLSGLRLAALQRGSIVRGALTLGEDGSLLRTYARIRGRRAIVARGTGGLRPAGRASFRLLLSRTAQVELRRRRRLTLIVTVRVSPPAGAAVTATRRVVLRPALSR
jgi:hypothetical protein